MCMEINENKIRKFLSGRSLPTDNGTVAAIAGLIEKEIQAVKEHPIPEGRLGTYLSKHFFSEFPLEERSVPGPVPSAILLLNELRARRAAEAAEAEPQADAEDALALRREKEAKR